MSKELIRGLGDNSPYTVPCKNEAVSGSSYCAQHQSRRKAIKEQASKDAEVVAIPLARAAEKQLDKEVSGTITRNMTGDNILEDVKKMIDRVVQFENLAFEAFSKVSQDDWRYRDKAGGEQLRAEVMVYERALDRSSRVLANVTKLGIDAQLASVTKSQYEMVKTVLMRTLMALKLTDEQMRTARDMIAAEFERLAKQ